MAPAFEPRRTATAGQRVDGRHERGRAEAVADGLRAAVFAPTVITAAGASGPDGLVQIHGRNAVDWPERLEFDAEYVDILGRWYWPLVDLWIIVSTACQIIWQAVTGRGVSAAGSVTMQEFRP